MTAAFLTVEEVADRWRCSGRAVRDAIARQELAATFRGGRWLIAPEDVEASEEQHRNIPRVQKRTRRPRKRVA